MAPKPALAAPVAPPAETPPVVDAGPVKPSILVRFRLTASQFFATRHFTRWSTLAVCIMFAVLFGLGTWQIIRLQQKNALITHITAQLAQPERDLRLRPPTHPADWQALDYRRIVLQGDWLELHPLKVLPRAYEGANGYHLFMPLVLPNGQIVLVNRGWAPDKTDIGPTSQTKSVIVAGIVRTAPVAKPFGMMDNNPAKDVWAWPDTRAIADNIGVQTLAPIIVYAERADTPADQSGVNKADEFPIGGQVQLEIRNEHKQYALTWYSLSLALLVIWLVAAKQPVAKEPAATETDGKNDS